MYMCCHCSLTDSSCNTDDLRFMPEYDIASEECKEREYDFLHRVKYFWYYKALREKSNDIASQ